MYVQIMQAIIIGATIAFNIRFYEAKQEPAFIFIIIIAALYIIFVLPFFTGTDTNNEEGDDDG